MKEHYTGHSFVTLWFLVAIFETVKSAFDLKEKNTSEKLEAYVIISFFENLMLGSCQATLPKTRLLIMQSTITAIQAEFKHCFQPCKLLLFKDFCSCSCFSFVVKTDWNHEYSTFFEINFVVT